MEELPQEFFESTKRTFHQDIDPQPAAFIRLDLCTHHSPSFCLLLHAFERLDEPFDELGVLLLEVEACGSLRFGSKR